VKLAREALHNVRQHAQAHTATMTLAYAPGRVELSVRDDGVGLLDGTYERPGLHALRALHYRLAEMDGRLDVFEPHDGGLVVRGSLPLGS
jgi:signal transduction histidine kinase